jgi:hypothetical protein
MRFEEWIIGTEYSVKDKGGTVTVLGRLMDKHELGDQVVLDFRKADGEEHRYIVEEGVTYIIHIPPPVPEDRENTVRPLTSADRD